MRARSLAFFIGALCLLLPHSASAEDAFTHWGQNIDLSVSIDGATLESEGAISIRTGEPVALTYSFAPRSAILANNPNMLSTREMYFELWRGIPFDGSGTLLREERIDPATSGTLSVLLPGPGDYFVTAFVSQDYKTLADCNPPPSWDEIDIHFNCFLYHDQPDFNNFFLGDPTHFESHPPLAWGGYHFVVTPATPTSPHQLSNILFLPGIKASRLYREGGERVWEPLSAHDVEALTLAEDGSGEAIYAGDPLDYPLGFSALGDFYGSFEHHLDTLVARGDIQAWRAFGYDWRQDVLDIARGQTPRAGGTSERLAEVAKELAATSPTGKITVIGHSNGGLLAKALAIALEESGLANILDSLILVGSPQIGTPLAIGALLHGDGQGLSAGPITLASAAAMRDASRFTPGAYGLLPSVSYFGTLHTSVVSLANGTALASVNALEAYLGDAARLNPNSSDTRAPLVLSPTLLAKEAATHAALDAWRAPAGVRVVELVGTGKSTVDALTYHEGSATSCSFSILHGSICSNKLLLNHEPHFTPLGDGTVVAASAASYSGSERWYFNLTRAPKTAHASLLANTEVEGFLDSLFGGTGLANDSFTETPPSQTEPELVVSVHSPATLLATDTLGNRTGFVFTDDLLQTLEEIPGSSAQIIDEAKYLLLPPGSYTFTFAGYDTGTATFDIGHLEDGIPVVDTAFTDIPITEQSLGTIMIDNTSILTLDQDGDGEADQVFKSPGIEERGEPVNALRVAIQHSHAKAFVKSRLIEALERGASAETLTAMVRSQENRTLPLEEVVLLLGLITHL